MSRHYSSLLPCCWYWQCRRRTRNHHRNLCRLHNGQQWCRYLLRRMWCRWLLSRDWKRNRCILHVHISICLNCRYHYRHHRPHRRFRILPNLHWFALCRKCGYRPMHRGLLGRWSSLWACLPYLPHWFCLLVWWGYSLRYHRHRWRWWLHLLRCSVSHRSLRYTRRSICRSCRLSGWRPRWWNLSGWHRSRLHYRQDFHHLRYHYMRWRRTFRLPVPKNTISNLKIS